MPRHNKFNAQRTTVDGITFASKREATRYGELRLLERAREIRGLRLQPKLSLDVNGEHVCTYVADFAYVKRGDSRETFEDVKGARTALFILKKKLVKAVHGIDVVEVR